MHKVALIRGDGIGPEIAAAATRVIEATGVAMEWTEAPMGQAAIEEWGAPIPLESIRAVRRLGVALKGPLIAEPLSGGVVVEENGCIRRHPSINNGVRRELGTYANLRPVRGFDPVSGAYREVDLVMVREVTEDIYAGREKLIDHDTAEAVKCITRAASERVARLACEYALRHGRRKISAIHKANVLHLTDGLFLESVLRVVREYPSLEFDDKMVDAAAYLMVKNPREFDVMVLPNQYGDILSDLAAGLVGSLGLAPGANFGEETAIFEASHGAAPDIAGRNVANPIALILSGAMLLDHIGECAAGDAVRRAVADVLRDGQRLTPDLGGRGSTGALTDSICAAVKPVRR